MRRRRKTRYNWLPTVGTPLVVGDELITTSTSQIFTLDVVANSADSVGVVPVVENDRPTQAGEISATLQNIIGNEYILKRIVGKCWVAITATNNASDAVTLDAIPTVLVGCGFFVSRTEPEDGFNIPVGGVADASQLYNPLNNALQREPWIWRRSWLLGVGTQPTIIAPNSVGDLIHPALTPGDTISPTWPSTNCDYPGVLDGPHVDAKTGRRVRQDESLFFAAAAHFIPNSSNDPTSGGVHVNVAFDVRCLGGLRRARNRSNF